MIEILLILALFIVVLIGIVVALWKRTGLLKKELINANNRAAVNSERAERVLKQQQQLNDIDEQQQRDLEHVKANLHQRNDFNATGL
jgi:uncharacterized membrane protein